MRQQLQPSYRECARSNVRYNFFVAKFVPKWFFKFVWLCLSCHCVPLAALSASLAALTLEKEVIEAQNAVFRAQQPALKGRKDIRTIIPGLLDDFFKK